ncbi:MAG TPA: hypothetical protein VNJ08_17655 [Bacteriovoracaceae bacterium]|nr:hypothetical protein [Bacteriovoracaceae bacterium]
MKYLSFLLLISCANHRTHSEAYDSLGAGSVHASATKRIENQDVCFDIALSMSGVSQSEASPQNWSLAWVDKKNQFHLLTLNQRDPASLPNGGSNTFHTCAASAELDNVKGLVLTPRELPFPDKRSLKLNWK